VKRLLRAVTLPLCDQFTLIGCRADWNVYYGFFALISGFCWQRFWPWARRPQPLAAQPSECLFFCSALALCSSVLFSGYFLFLSLKICASVLWDMFNLFALARGVDRFILQLLRLLGARFSMARCQSIPKANTEAADAMAFRGLAAFQAHSSAPTMLRLAWTRPIPTRAIFLVIMRQTLVFFTVFRRCNNAAMRFFMPAICGQNFSTRFVPYPILAGLFPFFADTCDHLCFGPDQSPS